ncbi:MAG: hypothetical protein J6X07_03660 [Prevotella sp.]|nr:hypothetical protein [Prevotella sp.]
MKIKELLAKTSLTSIGREIGLDVQMVEGYLTCTPLDPDDPRYSTDFILPSMKMVEACRANNFDFFLPWIEAGKITEEQMHHAAERYHLGKTKSGQPIFWMIDDMQDPLDAHIGNGWISTLLKKREPLLQSWHPTHCLFGLHLLSEETVAIVESEASAVVLSELFPESIWLSYATTAHLSPALFAPLEGRTVTLYPRTDPTLSTYLFFEELADQTRRQYDLDLTVDTTLEDHATDSQKERCIDILEFLLDSL